VRYLTEAIAAAHFGRVQSLLDGAKIPTDIGLLHFAIQFSSVSVARPGDQGAQLFLLRSALSG